MEIPRVSTDTAEFSVADFISAARFSKNEPEMGLIRAEKAQCKTPQFYRHSLATQVPGKLRPDSPAARWPCALSLSASKKNFVEACFDLTDSICKGHLATTTYVQCDVKALSKPNTILILIKLSIQIFPAVGIKVVYTLPKLPK